MPGWDGIYGQEIALNFLENIKSSQKIPHAFLFTGIEGIGKELTAIRFAQILNSNSANIEDTKILRQIAALSEPYLKYIFPLPRGKNETDENGPYDKLSADDLILIKEELNNKAQNPYHKIKIPKANNIKISSIRDIKKFISFNFEEIRYRIVLISDAHLMNEEAQNALLKNLEEPPPGIIYILTTSYPSRLRETIISRCTAIHFKPLDNINVVRILTEYYHLDDEQVSRCAVFSNGSVNYALKLMENDLDILLAKTIDILRYSFGKKYHMALNSISHFTDSKSTDLLGILINLILTWFNDVIRHRHSEQIYFKDYSETLIKFNNRYPDLDVTGIITKLEEFNSLIKNNLNTNLLVLNIIYELSALTE